MRILPSLVSMERAGLTVDQARLEDLGKLLQQKILTVRAEAERQVGKPFNLSSPKQVREILYTELKLDQRSGVVVASTAGGEKSTSENVLLKLKSFHPLVGLILQHRQLTKYKIIYTRYVDGILSHLSRVSTCWDQIAAATGRVTSVSPNLQAVPKGGTWVETGLSSTSEPPSSPLPAAPSSLLTSSRSSSEYSSISPRTLRSTRLSGRAEMSSTSWLLSGWTRARSR